MPIECFANAMFVRSRKLITYAVIRIGISLRNSRRFSDARALPAGAQKASA